MTGPLGRSGPKVLCRGGDGNGLLRPLLADELGVSRLFGNDGGLKMLSSDPKAKAGRFSDGDNDPERSGLLFNFSLILIPVPILVLIPVLPVVESCSCCSGCSRSRWLAVAAFLARAAAVAAGAVTSNGGNE